MKVIERVIKEKQGAFKLVNKPQVIGAKDEKDIEDLMQNINEQNEDNSEDEDNEEGMGDLVLEHEEGEGNEEEKK